VSGSEGPIVTISTQLIRLDRFAIGYVYSFVAAGLFYWLFNRLAPHAESRMDHAETGEDIIAANDAKNVQERRASWSEPGQKPNMLKRFFQV
jgi:nucleobase:cation symporter-1, NCS1 family